MHLSLSPHYCRHSVLISWLCFICPLFSPPTKGCGRAPPGAMPSALAPGHRGLSHSLQSRQLIPECCFSPICFTSTSSPVPANAPGRAARWSEHWGSCHSCPPGLSLIQSCLLPPQECEPVEGSTLPLLSWCFPNKNLKTNKMHCWNQSIQLTKQIQ